jgi:hypothetical protein
MRAALGVHALGSTPWWWRTGAGDDHGIDHHKNWLRFPYDSTFLRSRYLHPHPYGIIVIIGIGIGIVVVIPCLRHRRRRRCCCVQSYLREEVLPGLLEPLIQCAQQQPDDPVRIPPLPSLFMCVCVCPLSLSLSLSAVCELGLTRAWRQAAFVAFWLSSDTGTTSHTFLQSRWKQAAGLQAFTQLARGGGASGAQVRRPLRPFWRPLWLRFTYVASVLVKKY